jgi:hypothetical protein
MSWFFSTAEKTPTAAFGANLPIGNKALSAEIEEVGQKFVKTNKKYINEIDKYKKIADFNKKLSSSYIANVHAIIDVSKLLNDYAAFFNLLKDEINKTDGKIGTLQSSDIQYLENLTKAKMEEFGNKFIEQSGKVKDLYIKYGQESEAKTIVNAREQLMTTITNAGITHDSLIKANLSGGKSNKKPKKKVIETKKRVIQNKNKKTTVKK